MKAELTFPPELVDLIADKVRGLYDGKNSAIGIYNPSLKHPNPLFYNLILTVTLSCVTVCGIISANFRLIPVNP